MIISRSVLIILPLEPAVFKTCSNMRHKMSMTVACFIAARSVFGARYIFSVWTTLGHWICRILTEMCFCRPEMLIMIDSIFVLTVVHIHDFHISISLRFLSSNDSWFVTCYFFVHYRKVQALSTYVADHRECLGAGLGQTQMNLTLQTSKRTMRKSNSKFYN